MIDAMLFCAVFFLNLPNIIAQNRIKNILFQIVKKAGNKIFFYLINVDIRHPFQFFLLTYCGELFWTFFKRLLLI